MKPFSRISPSRMLAGIFLLLLAWVSPSGAREVMSISTGQNYPPYSGDNLPRGGMMADIITRLFEEMDVTVAFRRLPWKRALLQAQEGRVLASFPWEDKVELRRDFLMSEPVLFMDLHIYVDSRRGPVLKENEDLVGLRLCLPLGHQAHGLVDLYIRHKQVLVEQPASLKNCLEMLRLNRADFISASAMAAQQYGRQVYGYPEGVRRETVGRERVGLHLLFSRKHPHSVALKAAFDRLLAQYRADGRLVEIIAPHLWVP